jgi:tetratricopeptide (TPR) repeat protein
VFRLTGDAERALAEYERAIALNPKATSAYMGRAQLRQLQGRIDDALTDFDRAIGVNPASSDPLAGRGTRAGAQGTHGRSGE